MSFKRLKFGKINFEKTLKFIVKTLFIKDLKTILFLYFSKMSQFTFQKVGIK